MAKEKIRERVKFERPVISKANKKSKRNRHPTECSVIRRDRGCGICGSENIAEQGVEYCERCGKEVIIFRNTNNFGRWNVSNFCKCQKSWVVRTHVRYYKPYRTIAVLKCMDCGAVMSCFCPNCKPDRKCWYKAGKSYCRKCGFRKN